jgi:hypothetical protein
MHAPGTSPQSHVPFPHEGPQSTEQVHVSSPSHFPSPHTTGQAPQSALQLVQVSSPSHVPSPHTVGQAPQSALQLVQVSAPSHVPSPQTPPHPPHSDAQSAAHSEVQATVQHSNARSHTQLSQAHSPHPGKGEEVQPSEHKLTSLTVQFPSLQRASKQGSSPRPQGVPLGSPMNVQSPVSGWHASTVQGLSSSHRTSEPEQLPDWEHRSVLVQAFESSQETSGVMGNSQTPSTH